MDATNPADHNHPRFRLDLEMASIRADTDSDDDWIRVKDEPGRVEPLLAAVGAAFDRCRECVQRHARALAEEPLLVVWLAWGFAVNVGKWVPVPVGPDEGRKRWRLFAARVDPDAATVLDALYSSRDGGVTAALAAVRNLPVERRATVVDYLTQVMFAGLWMMNGPIDDAEGGLLNTGTKLQIMDQHGAFGW